MSTCINVKQLNEWQVEQLKEHLSKHRYYLGEKHQYPDDRALEGDFLDHYMNKVAEELRANYCGELCPHREGCELAQLFLKKILDT